MRIFAKQAWDVKIAKEHDKLRIKLCESWNFRVLKKTYCLLAIKRFYRFFQDLWWRGWAGGHVVLNHNLQELWRMVVFVNLTETWYHCVEPLLTRNNFSKLFLCRNLTLWIGKKPLKLQKINPFEILFLDCVLS